MFTGFFDAFNRGDTSRLHMYFDSNLDLFSVRKLAPDGQDVDQILVDGPASGWGVHPPDWAGALRTYVAEQHTAGERLGLRTIKVGHAWRRDIVGFGFVGEGETGGSGPNDRPSSVTVTGGGLVACPTQTVRVLSMRIGANIDASSVRCPGLSSSESVVACARGT